MLVSGIVLVVLAFLVLCFGDLVMQKMTGNVGKVLLVLAVALTLTFIVFGGGYGITFLCQLAEKQASKLNPVAMYELKLTTGEAKIENAKHYLVEVKTGMKNTEDDIAAIAKKKESYTKLVKDNKSNQKLIERYAKSIVLLNKREVAKQEQLTNYKVAYDELLNKIELSTERLEDAKVHLEDLKFQLESSDHDVALATIDHTMPDFSDFDLVEKEIKSRLNKNSAVMEVAKDLGHEQVEPEKNNEEVQKVLSSILGNN